LAARDAVIFAKAEGNTTTVDVPTKLKHLSAQVAIAPQSSILHVIGDEKLREQPAEPADRRCGADGEGAAAG
jgi:hypothetical protein